MRRIVTLLCLPILFLCCSSQTQGPKSFDRAEFNLAAQRLDIPLIWVADPDGDSIPDENEVVALAFFDHQATWVADGVFTEDFKQALTAIQAELDAPEDTATGSEAERRRLVEQELDQARPTLVAADLSELESWEIEMLDRLWKAGGLIDELYANQLGIAEMADDVPTDHPASRRLFARNNGPQCIAPLTQAAPNCSAIPESPVPAVTVYPAQLQTRDDFCAKVENNPETASPFTVVRSVDGTLAAAPYTEAYAEFMNAIAAQLVEAAQLIPQGQEESLRFYLEEAAAAFRNNDWPRADEAWAAMDATNSKWYLRIGPDETYWEPCSLKAGFHFTLARIDPSSIKWQEKLTPLRSDMEAGIANLCGPAYDAREVNFDLPDFLELIANFGDDRDPIGGTAGQSLPNWGAVANEGRGRTVAMTNLGTDPDSTAIRHAQLTAMIDQQTLDALSAESPRDSASLLNTILHEAAHNLGPAHEFEVDGQTDTDLFGGALATIMEELKAQTFGLWLIDFLEQRDIISAEQSREAYGAAFAWSMRHISRGMETPGGNPRAYSQLAAIQIGFLMDNGVLVFEPSATAANGKDTGAFRIDFEAMPAAWNSLAEEVCRIKATGDRDGARHLQQRYVEGDVVPFDLIEERTLRHPESTFVYTRER